MISERSGIPFPKHLTDEVGEFAQMDDGVYVEFLGMGLMEEVR